MNMNDGNADPSAANGAAARDDASHHHQVGPQFFSSCQPVTQPCHFCSALFLYLRANFKTGAKG